MAIDIILTDTLKHQADIHSKRRMSFEYDRFKLSDWQRRSMILIGTLGQLAFKAFLDKNDIKYDYQLQAGNYDDFDFKINNEIYEIKCSAYDAKTPYKYERLNLLYSKDQFQAGLNKNFKYCVQLFVDGYNIPTKLLDLSVCSHVTLYGYIPFQNIQNYPNQARYYGDDYKVPLRELWVIEELLKRLKAH